MEVNLITLWYDFRCTSSINKNEEKYITFIGTSVGWRMHANQLLRHYKMIEQTKLSVSKTKIYDNKLLINHCLTIYFSKKLKKEKDSSLIAVVI